MDDHAAVIFALLAAHPNLTVYDGPPQPGEDKRTPPYVVFYMHVPYERRTKLECPTDETWFTITTHSVGATTDAARGIAGHVRSALLDVRPVVAGWLCGRIEHDVGRSPDWEQFTGDLVADATDVWQYRAKPA